jgi:5-keto 4-deoxyuronate isomerase
MTAYHKYQVSVKKITDHIMSLREQFQKEHPANFFNEQQDMLIHTVVDRFALGGIMAKGNKNCGNVDTVHNAREGVYATDQERTRTKIILIMAAMNTIVIQGI